MSFSSLPKQFLNSVKVIFDVLDGKKQGFVSLSNIETKWNKENTQRLPVDFIECLRAVAPPSGQITFELFVLGVRNSLNKSQSRSFSHSGVEDDNSQPPPKPSKPFSLQQRSASSPFVQVKSVSREQLYGKEDNPISAKYQIKSQSTMDLVNSQPITPLTSNYKKADENDGYRRQIPKRRDSTRRHTLGHGVDGSMLRRSKLLEEERRMLLKGLQSVDKARHWYTKRLSEVADKQKYGTTEKSDLNIDQQQEKIKFEELRIEELNQQIDALTDPAAQGGLMRMNLARPIAMRQQTIPYEPASPSSPDSSHAMEMVRAQNKMLTKEVSQKAERIAQLEKEKATLLRDLFESRAHQRVQQKKSVANTVTRHLEDSTLM